MVPIRIPTKGPRTPRRTATHASLDSGRLTNPLAITASLARSTGVTGHQGRWRGSGRRATAVEAKRCPNTQRRKGRRSPVTPSARSSATASATASGWDDAERAVSHPGCGAHQAVSARNLPLAGGGTLLRRMRVPARGSPGGGMTPRGRFRTQGAARAKRSQRETSPSRGGDRCPLATGARPYSTASSPRSSTGAEWVIHPDEIRSTPASAIAPAVVAVTVPDASVTSRPPTMATASRSVAGDMLSSSTTRTAATNSGSARTEANCSSVSTSTSIDTRCPTPPRARRIACGKLPAIAMWLSLMRTASYSPNRWFTPPPARTAAFSSARSPGVVFRVHAMRACVCATAAARCAVAVATPLRWPRRLSATRSPVRRARVGPATSRTTSPGATASPSPRTTSTRTAGSSICQASQPTSTPGITPGCRATTRNVDRWSAGTMLFVVRSPAAPRSSASAWRTSGSSRVVGRAVDRVVMGSLLRTRCSGEHVAEQHVGQREGLVLGGLLLGEVHAGVRAARLLAPQRRPRDRQRREGRGGDAVEGATAFAVRATAPAREPHPVRHLVLPPRHERAERGAVAQHPDRLEHRPPQRGGGPVSYTHLTLPTIYSV